MHLAKSLRPLPSGMLAAKMMTLTCRVCRTHVCSPGSSCLPFSVSACENNQISSLQSCGIGKNRLTDSHDSDDTYLLKSRSCRPRIELKIRVPFPARPGNAGTSPAVPVSDHYADIHGNMPLPPISRPNIGSVSQLPRDCTARWLAGPLSVIVLRMHVFQFRHVISLMLIDDLMLRKDDASLQL